VKEPDESTGMPPVGEDPLLPDCSCLVKSKFTVPLSACWIRGAFMEGLEGFVAPKAQIMGCIVSESD